jgi:hypothetical protein
MMSAHDWFFFALRPLRLPTGRQVYFLYQSLRFKFYSMRQPCVSQKPAAIYQLNFNMMDEIV